MKSRRIRGLPAVICLLGFLLAPTARATHEWFVQEPPLLSLHIGAAGVLDTEQDVYWGAEYRPAFRFCHFGPWLMIGAGRNQEFYSALGVLLNIQLGHGWVLTPAFGGGYYNASSGLDLGFDAEFRSSIELTRCFANGQRIGLGFAHLSNGSLSEHNPGTETLYVSYAFPLDIFFSHPAAAPPRVP